ncbi:hypothetical protein MBLNU459_g6585t1 [Dothideomycetes sp. NU459]
MASENDHTYANLVQAALTSIASAYSGAWCLPRVSDSLASPRGKKRKAGDMQAGTVRTSLATEVEIAAVSEEPQIHEVSQQLPPHLLEHCSSRQASVRLPHTVQWISPTSADESLQATLQHEDAYQPDHGEIPWEHYLSNPSATPRDLQISTAESGPFRFRIPPGASFFLGDCSDSNAFHNAVRTTAQEQDTARQFELVIMDPPWPNASVKRTHATGQGRYQILHSVWDIRQLIFEMDIDVLLARDGLVAIWITNKPAVRELVLGEDGLFDCWGVVLEEEWLWVKTTTKGEPVTQLDGLWRKPYEVLLIGRKRALRVGEGQPDHGIRRRVIAGVPDLHSRKPCLKELLEKLVSDPAQYRALEIFARYLVAGWWSWGNEAIKFNHERCYLSP